MQNTALLTLIAACAWACPALVRAESTPGAAPPGDIDVSVTLDPSAQSGRASASVQIRADRAVIWKLLTSCGNARKLVPGLTGCEVLDSAPDHSWQLIRHRINYSWYVPRVDFVFRADYRYPEGISMHRVSGNLKVFEGQWNLDRQGEFTRVRYSLTLAPGFWVPKWLVQAALKHDLPRMLSSLRTLAEAPAAADAAHPAAATPGNEG